MDEPEVLVGGRRAPAYLDAVPPVQTGRADQVPGQEHPVRPERVTGAVVVDPHLGTADQRDVSAHETLRTAAVVRSRSRAASSSEIENGGPSITRSPLVPSTCPVEE